ncbi:hypothetical protein RPPS3_20210 [Rhodopseudomonas palustris]|nr:hypothetical protein RPPS3_20210 [Rhodopseudomonas palustris]
MLRSKMRGSGTLRLQPSAQEVVPEPPRAPPLPKRVIPGSRYARPEMTVFSNASASSGLTHLNSGNWCRNQVNCRLA